MDPGIVPQTYLFRGKQAKLDVDIDVSDVFECAQVGADTLRTSSASRIANSSGKPTLRLGVRLNKKVFYADYPDTNYRRQSEIMAMATPTSELSRYDDTYISAGDDNETDLIGN